VTLGEFAEAWWRTYAIPNLAPKARRIYAELWDRHVLPRAASDLFAFEEGAETAAFRRGSEARVPVSYPLPRARRRHRRQKPLFCGAL
jgi:hypothetical protein